MEPSCSDHESHRLNLKLKHINSQQNDQPQQSQSNSHQYCTMGESKPAAIDRTADENNSDTEDTHHRHLKKKPNSKDKFMSSLRFIPGENYVKFAQKAIDFLHEIVQTPTYLREITGKKRSALYAWLNNRDEKKRKKSTNAVPQQKVQSCSEKEHDQVRREKENLKKLNPDASTTAGCDNIAVLADISERFNCDTNKHSRNRNDRMKPSSRLEDWQKLQENNDQLRGFEEEKNIKAAEGLPIPVVLNTIRVSKAEKQTKEAEEGTDFSINSIYGSDDDDDDDGKTLILSLDSDDGSIISEKAEKEVAFKKRSNTAEEDRDAKVQKTRKDNYKKVTIAGGTDNDDSACSKPHAASNWTSQS